MDRRDASYNENILSVISQARVLFPHLVFSVKHKYYGKCHIYRVHLASVLLEFMTLSRIILYISNSKALKKKKRRFTEVKRIYYGNLVILDGAK